MFTGWTEWQSLNQPSGTKVGGLYLSGGEYELTENIRSNGISSGSPEICQKEENMFRKTPQEPQPPVEPGQNK